ncbi:MAG: alpha-amylase family glycosyl hydrolase [Lentisphaeria bacterium]|nr:alpha-amylase family glycosyl hydrolase [Lentisphaeria bacterium]
MTDDCTHVRKEGACESALLLCSLPEKKQAFFRVNANEQYPLKIQMPEQLGDVSAVRLAARITYETSPLYFDASYQKETSSWTTEISVNKLGSYDAWLEYKVTDTWKIAKNQFAFLADPQNFNKLKIYTIIPVISGTLDEMSQDLDNIAALGFNMVHLLPLSQTAYSESPYAAKDLLKLDPHFLPDNKSQEESLDTFAQKCKNLGIGICVDLVFNHVGTDSALVDSHPEWFCRDLEEENGLKRAGWSDGHTWYKWEDLVLLDYQKRNLKVRADLFKYMKSYVKYWVRFAAKSFVPMIRLDNLHSSDPIFVRECLDELREEFPNLIILGELFGNNIEKQVMDYSLNLILATPWEHKFSPQLRNYLQYTHNHSHQLRFYCPSVSHDSGFALEEFGSTAATLSRLYVCALLGAGPWGIVQGLVNELEQRPQFIGFKDRMKLNFNTDLVKKVTHLNEILNQENCFLQPGNIHFVLNEHDAIIAAIRKDPQSGKPIALVLVNMDYNHEQWFRLEKDIPGIQEFDFSEEVISNKKVGISLEEWCAVPAGQSWLFRSKK